MLTAARVKRYRGLHFKSIEDRNMTNDEMEKVVRRYIAAYNSYDINAMVAPLHPEVHFRNISNGQVTAETKGIDRFRQLAAESESMFSSRRQRVSGIDFGDNVTVVDIEYEGVLAVDLPDVARSGDTLKFKGKSEFVFESSKIIGITDVS